MSAAEKEVPSVRVTACMASEQPWVSCTDDIQAKVLAVDESRFSVEFLFKIAAGYRSGKHKHTCETSVLVLQGKVRNETTGVEFGPGDFCYQPYNDTHDEHFVEETIVYASYRGHEDKLVEFYDDKGEICGEFLLSEFAGMLPQ